jgi:hypothetical protein
MSEETPKLYIAEREVTGYRVVEGEETPSGGLIVEVVYEDGSTARFTEAKFNAVRTNEKSDATAARDRLVKEAGRKVYALLMEYGPGLYEVDHILNEAVRLANDATEEAMNALWGVKHASQRTLLDVNKILSKHYAEGGGAKEEAAGGDGAAPERDSADTADTK